MQPWCSYIYIVFVFINIVNFVFVLITIVNFVFVLLNIVFVLINIVFIGTSLIFLAPPWEFSSLGFTTLLLSGERPPRTLNFDTNDLHCYKESCTWMRKLLGHNCCLFKSFEGLYDFSFCKMIKTETDNASSYLIFVNLVQSRAIFPNRELQSRHKTYVCSVKIFNLWQNFQVSLFRHSSS